MNNRKEYMKQYYAENAEKIRTREKQYRAENAEKIKTRRKQYHAEIADRRKKYTHTINCRYTCLKSKAKQRSLQVTLTFQEYELLIVDQNCHYCEGPLPAVGHGLDRIDSNQGYTTDNVVPCCARCNKVLLDMPKQEAYAHIRQMLQVYEKKLAMIYQNSTMNKEEL